MKGGFRWNSSLLDGSADPFRRVVLRMRLESRTAIEERLDYFARSTQMISLSLRMYACLFASAGMLQTTSRPKAVLV